MALENNMPPDPFGIGPDMSQFGVNCMAMINAMIAAGMPEPRADSFVAEVVARMAEGRGKHKS